MAKKKSLWKPLRFDSPLWSSEMSKSTKYDFKVMGKGTGQSWVGYRLKKGKK